MRLRGWFDVRQVVFALFREMFCVSDPVAGFARAGSFVVVQLAVERLDELDALAERSGQRLDRHFFEFPEILETGFPTAIFAGAVVTAFTRGFKQVVVLVIVFFDEVLNEYTGIGKRFYELLPHDFLLLLPLRWICHILP